VADRRSRLEARVAKLERAVVLAAAWLQECRDLGLSARTTAEVAFRGHLGKAEFATAQCSAEAFLRALSEQFARNVKKRLGKRVNRARPERVKASRRGR